MTVEKAIKHYKLDPCSEYISKEKAFELNVNKVLYMNVQKNKYAYIVQNGPKKYLYHDERSIYTKLWKGLKIEPLEN